LLRIFLTLRTPPSYSMDLIVPIANYIWTILTISTVAGFTAESGLGADF